MCPGVGGQKGLGGLQIPEIGEKAGLLRVRKAVQRELGRGGEGQGEVILPRDALLPAEGDKAENGLVLVLAGAEKGGVKRQAVGVLIGDKGAAGTVRDDASGGLDVFHAGDGLDGLGQIILVVDNLNIEKHHQINAQQRQRQRGDDVEPGDLSWALIHGDTSLIGLRGKVNRPRGPDGRRGGTAMSSEGSTKERRTAPGG